MQSFDLTAHHSLLQAFDLTGRRIFSDAWTGTEAWTRRADDPSTSKTEKAAIVRSLAEIAGKKAVLSPQINFEDDEEQRKVAQEKFVSLSRQERLAEDRLRHFPPQYDGWIEQHDNFVRRSQIEDLLLGAFSTGALQIYFGGGVAVPWEDWRHRSAFKVYITLSLIRVPRSERSDRGIVKSDRDSTITRNNPFREPNRLAAFVDVAEFNHWVLQYSTDTDAVGILEPETQCAAMLEDMILRFGDNSPGKAECWRDCKAAIPNLAERQFLRIWAKVAPKRWQKAGRKS